MRALALPRGERFAVLAGALLVVLAYPPFHLFVPSFVCLVPAVWLILQANDDPHAVTRHLAQGFWYGLLANGLVLYWMVAALWHFTPLSAAGYAATIFVEALWWGVIFAATGWFRRRTKLPLPLLFAVVWTAVEWVIGHQGDIRFPWLGLGTSLTHYLLPIQLAEVVGARGITFLLALANGGLALAWVARQDRPRALRLVATVAGGVVVASVYGAVRMGSILLRDVGTVAAIQPNVGMEEKWVQATQDSIVTAMVAQSSDIIVQSHPGLVLWPEVAVPGVLVYRPQWQGAIEDQARRARLPLVVGAIDQRIHPDRSWDNYNAAFLVDPDGRIDRQPVYHKHYLVPIVERVPFINPKLLHIQFFGSFGVGEQGPVYKIPIGKFGVMICYESAFEDLARDYRRRGADFLVNITNDAWFGRSAAPYQHAAHLVMRAIETRVGIARGANTGISEFVDPLGREYHQTRLEERTAIADIVRTTDVITLYTRLGDWVGVFSVAAALALGFYAWRRPR